MGRLRSFIGPWPLERWFLPIAILFFEVVFKGATTGGWFPQLVFVALFSLVIGQVLWLLVSLLPSRRAQERVATVLIVLIGVVYAIEYFVYREFKVFYDLNTVTAGAGGVADQFGDSVTALVFSASGILHILAFLAPAGVYALLCHVRRLPPRPTRRGTAKTPAQLASELHARVFTSPHVRPLVFARIVGEVAVLHLVCLLAVSLAGSWGRSYSDRYSFQDAVTNYGLLTGLRKEVQRAVTGESVQVSFSSGDAEAISGEPVEVLHHTESTQASIFGTNVTSLDFDKLSASTSNSTFKQLDSYVSSLTPSSKNGYTGLFAGKNLIFVSAEAFSREVIREDFTPTLWRMAVNGIQFVNYYQYDNCGTTGGELQNLFGLLPTEGGKSFKSTAEHNNYLTLSNALNRLGYNGWAFHNNSTYFYNRDVTHNVLGYNNGYMGMGDGMEQWVVQQWPESDLEMVKGTFENLVGDAEPFNAYYMSVSGHSEYNWTGNAMSVKNRAVVEATPSLARYSEPVQAYLAANYELEAAMAWLVNTLESRGMADDTVIVIAADHFPYGLDNDTPPGQSMPYTSELYGYEVENYFQRDHNRLIVWSGCLEKKDPVVVDTPTCSLDILPTLLNLFGCEWDSRLLPGRDVFSDRYSLVPFLTYDWKTSYGTYFANEDRFETGKGIKESDVPKGYVEAMSAVVADKINYCRGVLTADYWRHLYGTPEDAEAVHDAAVKTGPKAIAEERYEDTLRRVAGRLRLREA